MTEAEWEVLHDAAREVRERAYAPYSGYRVGAALLTEGGEVFAGANVENASYGLSICAERSAVAAAVAAGALRFRGIAVVTQSERPAAPCGMCRQVLYEFGPPFPVRCYNTRGAVRETDVVALLPDAFGPDQLEDDPGSR